MTTFQDDLQAEVFRHRVWPFVAVVVRPDRLALRWASFEVMLPYARISQLDMTRFDETLLHLTARHLKRPAVNLLNLIEMVGVWFGFLGSFMFLGMLADHALAIHIRPQRFVRHTELIAATGRRLAEFHVPVPKVYQADDRTHRGLAWGVVITFVLLSTVVGSATGILLVWGLCLAVLAALIWLGPGVDLLAMVVGRAIARRLVAGEAWLATFCGLLTVAEFILFLGWTIGDWF